MRESKWIPSSTEHLHVPIDLYVVNPAVVRLLGKKIPYVHNKISNEDFKEVLGE